jgi:hypothetical protein
MSFHSDGWREMSQKMGVETMKTLTAQFIRDELPNPMLPNSKYLQIEGQDTTSSS